MHTGYTALSQSSLNTDPLFRGRETYTIYAPMYPIDRKRKSKREKYQIRHLPKVNPSELINALLQITIETDETTDRLRAPTVPS
jgi:hypothetical protein